MSRDELVAKIKEQKILIKRQAIKLGKQKKHLEQKIYNFKQMEKRIIEHRKQIEYKDRTLILYRRLLEQLSLKNNDIR